MSRRRSISKKSGTRHSQRSKNGKRRTRRRVGGRGAKRGGGLVTDIGPVIPAPVDLQYLKGLGSLDALRAKQQHTRKPVVGGKRKRKTRRRTRKPPRRIGRTSPCHGCWPKCKCSPKRGCGCGPACGCKRCRVGCGRVWKPVQYGCRCRTQRGGEGAGPARLSWRAIRNSAEEVWSAATGSEVGQHIRNLPKQIGKQIDFLPTWMPKSLRA